MTPRSTDPSTPTPARSSLRRALPVAIASLMLGTAVIASPFAATGAAPAEIVSNPSFNNGVEGWRTSGFGRSLESVRSSGQTAARLTTTRTMNAILYDDAMSVADAGPKGSTYELKARVRTTTPGVNGALRLRETAPGGATTHRLRFSLENTKWTNLTLTVDTARPGAALDLSVAAWRLAKGKDLIVDFVSLKSLDGAVTPPATTTPPTTAPPTTTPPTTAPPAVAPPTTAPPATAPSSNSCSAPVPAGTTFGTSISAVGQSAKESLRQNDQRFGKVGVVRDFFPGLPAGWKSNRMTIHEDRDVVVSFRITPQAILSGKHDTYFKNWFASAPDSRTIYWTYHHEPEGEVKAGDFTLAQYRNAWKRLDRFADAACKPNMHATLILSAWTSRPQANPTWTAFDAGPDVIDVLAFDPYNRIFQPNGDTYDSPEKIFGPIADVMRADPRPVGIAELGSRLVRGDSNGAGRAAWLRNMGNYAVDAGFTFVSYFQSTRGADWRLMDSRSVSAWSKLVKNSPR